MTGKSPSTEDIVHEKSGDLTTRPAEFSDSEAAEDDIEMSEKEKNRILRKIDRAIIPYATLLYLLSFLDRVNIGQAKVAGMNKELKVSTFLPFKLLAFRDRSSQSTIWLHGNCDVCIPSATRH